MKLNQKQEEVYQAITKANSGSVFGLRGYAGTGKTAVASAIINNPRFEKVLVAAPTGGALDVLRRRFDNDPEMDRDKISYSTLALLMKQPQSHISYKKWRYSLTQDGVDKLIDALANEGVNTAGHINSVKRKGETVWLVDVQALNSQLPKSKYTLLEEGVEFNNKDSDDITKALEEFDLVIVDESSMVDAGTYRLLTQAHKAIDPEKAPILVFCGDDGQLPPVASKGAPVRDSMPNPMMVRTPNDKDIFLLTEQMRSTDNVGKLAIEVRQGADLVDCEGVTVHSYKQLNLLYAKNRQLMKDSDVVLTFMNKTVEALNDYLRRDKGFSGEVAAGERLVVLRNYWAKDPGHIDPPSLLLTTSEVVEVAEVYTPEQAVNLLSERAEHEGLDMLDELALPLQDTKYALRHGNINLVRFTNGKLAFIEPEIQWRGDLNFKMIGLDVNSLLPYIRIPLIEAKFAYAMTVHKSQGSEFEKVVYIATRKHLNIQRDRRDSANWRAPYTAITRARTDITVLFSESGDF